VFPGKEKLTYYGVSRLMVADGGHHYLETVNNTTEQTHLHIIAPKWIAIEIDADMWSIT